MPDRGVELVPEKRDVMGEVRRKLKRLFDEQGIGIPWPHTKVYFGNTHPSIGGTQPMPERSTNTKTQSP